MTMFKFTSVNVTPVGSHPKTKWLEYRVNDITIAHAHRFICSGRFNSGRIGKSFHWNHVGLESLFGTEQYNNNIKSFVSPRVNLIYGTGSTITLKHVKEILTTI